MKNNKSIQSYNIFFKAIARINPRYLIHNSMLMLIFIFACIATLLFIREVNFAGNNIALYFQLTFWIWMTLFFSTLADSYAESKMYNYDDRAEDRSNFIQDLRKISNIKDINNFSYVEHQNVKAGNLILLQSGDVVPFDGKLVSGKCYVNETDVTGELESQFKTHENNDVLIAGSVLQGSESVVLKVSFSKNISFLARAIKRIQDIRRESLPSEVALQRLILGLSLLFMSVIFVVWAIAKYSGFTIPIIYLVDLAVVLLPTTISGLQHAIIIFGKARLLKSGIIVHDIVSLDNLVDANILLLDKTGTLTVGRRQMTDFLLVADFIDDEYLDYLYLSSLYDRTAEGKSIKEYAENRLITPPSVQDDKYSYFDFSASKPISGCDYGKIKIRKGSVNQICKYLRRSEKNLPKSIKEAIVKVARSHGTPLLLVVGREIIGVIHLRDRFRRGVKKQIDRLIRQGIKVKIVTGDNEQTANFVAEKLGIDSVHFDATPELKLEIVEQLQDEGYIVAMCGDGINDALALAQADIGFTFEGDQELHPIMAGNIVSKTNDLSALIELKNICKKMTVRRGSLTVFSLASDIVKYFLIVPSMFTTAFPTLSVLNFMHFQSLESVVLSSVMFNALVIFVLTPIMFRGFNKLQTHYSVWFSLILYFIGGLLSPLIFIKLIEMFILSACLL